MTPCKNPFMRGVIPLPCASCSICRRSRAKNWASRLKLERMFHQDATFVTLTYQDSEVSDISSAWSADRPVIGNLVPKDPQKFIRKLRKMVDSPLRFFLVGEYGDVSQRPHYHLALFGLPNCVYGKTRTHVSPCCGNCAVVNVAWAKGHSYLGELNSATASYIAGYVTKKWTKEDQWTKQKLKGRHPEFARMSLKPGIGAIAIKKLINFTAQSRAGNHVNKCIDAPVVLRNDGSMLSLGRYLRRKWREALGREADPPQSVVQEHYREMLRMFQDGKEQAQKKGVPSCFIDPKTIYLQRMAQQIKNLDAIAKIRQKEKSL